MYKYNHKRYKNGRVLPKIVFILEGSFVQGNIGEDACPVGSFPIHDSTQCKAVSYQFGYPYDATGGIKTGTPLCNYCTGEGCSTGQVRFSSDHGSLAYWLCKKG